MPYTDAQFNDYKENKRIQQEYFNKAIEIADAYIKANNLPNTKLDIFIGHLKGTARNGRQGVEDIFQTVNKDKNIEDIKKRLLKSNRDFLYGIDLLLRKDTLTEIEYGELPPAAKPNYLRRDNPAGKFFGQYGPEEIPAYTNYVRKNPAGGRRTRYRRRNKRKVTRRHR